MPEAGRGTIIFDLDGTLVDSAPDLANALDLLLLERGHAPLGLTNVRALIGHGIGELVRKGLAERSEFLPPDRLAQAVERFLVHYTANLSRHSSVYPYAAVVLETLQHAGWRLVVCTNKLEASARRLLQDLGLLHFFVLVAGPDTFSAAKPDPAHLLGCLPAGRPASYPAVMIGDSEVDIAAAKAANIPVIAVTWGYAKRPLGELGADRVADHMHDVPDCVAALMAEPTVQFKAE
jgi:phosphoglycolate phosphatase